MTPADLRGVQAVVYDLDGTLYDDEDHFDVYAEQLRDRLPPGRRDAFWAAWLAARADRHPLRVGTVYDAERGWVLRPEDGRLVEAVTMDGRPVPPAEWPPGYGEALVPDGRRRIAVGDMWWVPACLALFHGGRPEVQREAFLATRAWMASPAFRPTPVPGLRDAIDRLRRAGVYQAVATNSPAPESEVLLERLGLIGLFDAYVYEAGKPAGLERLLRDVIAERELPAAAVISVGDNPMNDIEPALALGCGAVFVDRHGMGGRLAGARVLRLSAARELPRVLRGIAGGD